MLAGSSLSAADAALWPSIVLCQQTLPTHFGWTEWTDEALFWRRPRLHAWAELSKAPHVRTACHPNRGHTPLTVVVCRVTVQYEQACRLVEEQISARLQELDLSAIAMDVPTSQLRTFPKHAL